jgi:4-amino-4-deoxy-L-arabinose transferase-like glycosyltransferase
MEGVERVWHRRLRWRLRGAWQWPAFLALTLVDAVLLVLLPPYDGAPEHLFPGVLLAGFANLIALILLAPPLGRALRRRRPDLPRMVAANYAGAGVVAAITGLLAAGGLAHRSAEQAEDGRRQSVAAAMHAYVIEQAPQYRDSLGAVDTIRIDTDYYRACIPGEDARHWFCLFVTTDQHPPGVTRDTEEVSNEEAYRPYGGFD